MFNRISILKKTAVVLAVATLASGCATVQKVALDPAGSAALQGKTLVLTQRTAKPDFTAFTAGKAALGILGAMAMVSAGNDIIKLNNVEDPANAIGAAMAKKLEAARGMKVISPAVGTPPGDADVLVAATKGAARYVLDVQTTGWQLLYYPTNWARYRVQYIAQARLIDAETKKVVAHGLCQRMPDVPAATAPTYDELVLNGAVGLKKELAAAAESCAQSMAAEMLAL